MENNNNNNNTSETNINLQDNNNLLETNTEQQKINNIPDTKSNNVELNEIEIDINSSPTNSIMSNRTYTAKEINELRQETMKKREEEYLINELDMLENENVILRKELTNRRNNNMDEINKIESELNYKRIIQQIKNNDNIDKMYIELENGRRKNEYRRQLGLIGGEDTIKLYPIGSYSKSCCNFLSLNKKNNIIEDFDKIYEIITNLPSLNNYEKNLILLRFSNIQSYCSRKYNRISKLYNSSQIFLIACSIINPALLSVNINRTNSYYNFIFWTVWVLQLLVSLITGYISLFKWDKKNFLFNIYKTKINQEIWFFIGLTGKNYTNTNGNYNHSDHINLFLNRLEKIYTMLKTTEFEMENLKESETNPNPNPNAIGNGNYNNLRPADILQSRLAQPR